MTKSIKISVKELKDLIKESGEQINNQPSGQLLSPTQNLDETVYGFTKDITGKMLKQLRDILTSFGVKSTLVDANDPFEGSFEEGIRKSILNYCKNHMDSSKSEPSLENSVEVLEGSPQDGMVATRLESPGTTPLQQK